MAKKHTIFFDFDGVLADSWWLTHKTSKKEFPELTEELHRDGFEGNIYDFDQKAAHLQRTHIDYEAEYEKEMHLVRFFDVEAVVRELAAQYRLTIVSSSWNRIISAYLEREKLSAYFDDVLGGDIHKSKHKKILSLLEKYAIEPREGVMVTDTLGDIREARLAGVDSIGVSWGFHEVHRLEKEKTFRIVHTPREIVSTVHEYFAGK